MDCYKILGIARDANLKDINSAYKTLALKHHPDKTGGDDHAILQFQRVLSTCYMPTPFSIPSNTDR
jgi:curved DNA-binding protein CbpA